MQEKAKKNYMQISAKIHQIDAKLCVQNKPPFSAVKHVFRLKKRTKVDVATYESVQ